MGSTITGGYQIDPPSKSQYEIEPPKQTDAELNAAGQLHNPALQGIGDWLGGRIHAATQGFTDETPQVLGVPADITNKIRQQEAMQNIAPHSALANRYIQSSQMALPAPEAATKSALNLAAQTAATKAGAGQTIGAIEQALATTPVDTTPAMQSALKARDLAAGGQTLPQVFSKFLDRMGLGATPATPGPPAPLTFPEARAFAKNAGALSANESMAANPEMKAYIADFANKMKSAINDTAVNAGHAPTWQEALKDYAKATTMQQRMAVVKEWGIDTIIKALKYAPVAGIGGLAASQGWKLGQELEK